MGAAKVQTQLLVMQHKKEVGGLHHASAALPEG